MIGHWDIIQNMWYLVKHIETSLKNRCPKPHGVNTFAHSGRFSAYYVSVATGRNPVEPARRIPDHYIYIHIYIIFPERCEFTKNAGLKNLTIHQLISVGIWCFDSRLARLTTRLPHECHSWAWRQDPWSALKIPGTSISTGLSVSKIQRKIPSFCVQQCVCNRWCRATSYSHMFQA